jgi:hypothetical protein
VPSICFRIYGRVVPERHWEFLRRKEFSEGGIRQRLNKSFLSLPVIAFRASTAEGKGPAQHNPPTQQSNEEEKNPASAGAFVPGTSRCGTTLLLVSAAADVVVRVRGDIERAPSAPPVSSVGAAEERRCSGQLQNGQHCPARGDSQRHVGRRPGRCERSEAAH